MGFNKVIPLIFAGFVVIMSCVLASFLAFTDFYSENVFGQRRTILIYMLYGYAVFRVIRIYISIQKNKKQDVQ